MRKGEGVKNNWKIKKNNSHNKNERKKLILEKKMKIDLFYYYFVCISLHVIKIIMIFYLWIQTI